LAVKQTKYKQIWGVNEIKMRTFKPANKVKALRANIWPIPMETVNKLPNWLCGLYVLWAGYVDVGELKLA